MCNSPSSRPSRVAPILSVLCLDCHLPQTDHLLKPSIFPIYTYTGSSDKKIEGKKREKLFHRIFKSVHGLDLIVDYCPRCPRSFWWKRKLEFLLALNGNLSWCLWFALKGRVHKTCEETQETLPFHLGCFFKIQPHGSASLSSKYPLREL